MASSNDRFPEAARDWDLETLYTDLASAKGKRL
ncbi:MAG: helix-turn-helix domain-containing protein, partial [Microcoleus sp. PH2017_06_SFM_O_A]|nr:helix-turn-helix domain-containing protein [Microcoleus sp. PH2017_06_SFM_O_A]